jgi:small subunit ribosomal protein S2
MGGIKDMGGLPDVLFIIDTNREKIAVEEAGKLGIPVIAVLDSNSDPAGITYPVPGNDDAIRAIETYCTLVSDAVLDGIQQEMIAAGVDVGAAEQAPVEVIDEVAAPAEAAAEAKPAGGVKKAPVVERKKSRAVKGETEEPVA